jgi:hypothetical protein
MVSNEVYTGAGLSATLIPEMEFDLGLLVDSTYGYIPKEYEDSGNDSSVNYNQRVGWTESDSRRLIAGLYQGCMAKVTEYSEPHEEEVSEQTVLIKNNGANFIEFNYSLHPDTTKIKCIIQSYGAPVYAPSPENLKPSVLSDNWLGLVETFSPPTVDVETKQLGLALGGTRNFGYQFKIAETLGDASIDISVNNGSWLYYVLGKQSIATTTTTTTTAVNPANGMTYHNDAVTDKFYRAEGGAILPPLPNGATLLDYKQVTETANHTYTFTESNGSILPSFALEVTNEKGNVASASYFQDSAKENLFSRIFTGCQVDTLTLTFEEGMELKGNATIKSRYAFDTPENYVPKRMVTDITELYNHRETSSNTPFMFSDGSIKIFGQTLARVKSGSVTITNTLMPQRFIGNYNRKITSTHLPGQRTYDVQLSLLITDRTIWDALRDADEIGDSSIELSFVKDDSEEITIKFKNYIVTMVDMPFPTDKSAVEVSLTAQARTLEECKYIGKWIIQG